MIYHRSIASSGNIRAVRSRPIEAGSTEEVDQRADGRRPAGPSGNMVERHYYTVGTAAGTRRAGILHCAGSGRIREEGPAGG